MSVKELAKLIELHAELEERLSGLESALKRISDENDSREHVKCYVMIQQGLCDPEYVRVSEDIVRNHFQLALHETRNELDALNTKLSVLS